MFRLSRLVIFCGLITTTLIPILHIWVLFHYYKEYANRVNKETCTCGCWDSVFKASHETGSLPFYKHMYFNATRNCAYIWLLIVMGLLGLSESTKSIVTLAMRNSIRLSMAVLFCLALPSLYSGWWEFINYFNDDYYDEFKYQVGISTADIISTSVLLNLANTRVQLKSQKLAIIALMAFVRISIRLGDHVIEVVFLNNERPSEQFTQNVVYMIPDAIHLLVSFFLICRKRKLVNFELPREENWNSRHFLMLLAFASVVFLVGTMILSNSPNF